ncbi:hypothetical protein LDENG_00052050 [Lucifuga dentata]|nr:hypothetical protein LDENG_00052050 [Lucifuga dentata]
MWSNCFPARDPGQLVKIYNIMDSIKYQQILNQNLTASGRKLQLDFPAGQCQKQNLKINKEMQKSNTKSRFCHSSPLT